MDWARLMVGVVLFLTPHGIHANGNMTSTRIHWSRTATFTTLTTKRPTTTRPTTTRPTTTRPTTTPPTTTQPPTTTMKDEIITKDIPFAGQVITLLQNMTDKTQFHMCVHDTGSSACKQCFEFTKEECNKEPCWKIQGKPNDVQRLNYIVGALGATIGLLLVVLVATTVAFLFAHASKYKKTGYVQHENAGKTCSVQGMKSPEMKSPIMKPPKRESLESCPEIPRRPEIPKRPDSVDETGGYIMGKDINAVVPWRVGEMEYESGLHGDVRLTRTEYDMQIS